MAIPTRETSGLEIRIDGKGRMKFSVAGIAVPTFDIATESNKLERGITVLRVPTQFITFIHTDSEQAEDGDRPVP